MRRLIKLLAVLTVMAIMAVMMAAPEFAGGNVIVNNHAFQGGGELTCTGSSGTFGITTVDCGNAI